MEQFSTQKREELYRKAAKRVCELALDKTNKKFRLKNILNEKAVKMLLLLIWQWVEVQILFYICCNCKRGWVILTLKI